MDRQALAEKLLAKHDKQKAYDRFYTAKQKHTIDEYKRLVKENGLEGELVPFNKTVEDFA